MSLLGLVAGILWLVLIFVVLSMLGAHSMRLFEGKVGGATGFALSLAFAFGVSLFVPALLDWRMTQSARAREADSGSMFGKTSALWNSIVLLILVFALPLSTRSALAERGDWLAVGLWPAAGPSVRTASAWIGEHIPRSGAAGDPTPSPSSGAVRRPEPVETGAELQPRQLFERFADTVVVIHVQKELSDGDPLSVVASAFGIRRVRGLGSGFIVDADGLIVTNHHVVEGATSLEVVLQDQRRFSPVDVLVVDTQNDLALVSIKATGLHQATIADNERVVPGDRAIAIGAPLGLTYSLTDGIVSAVRELQGTTFLQMQTTIAPGSSGSPLFDSHGRVMGVNTAGRQPGLNLAVAARHVRELLKRPRTAKNLVPFVHGPELTDVRVEGAETSSVDRMGLQDALEQIVVVLENCARDPVPDNARATFTFPVTDLTPAALLAWAKPPEVETNLAPASSQCLLSNAKYGGPLLSAWLLQNQGGPLERGKAVALLLQVDGFGAGPTDPAGKRLALRFRLEGGRGAGTGSSGAGSSGAGSSGAGG